MFYCVASLISFVVSILAHKSLDTFCEKNAERVQNKGLIYTKDYRREHGVEYVPVYMTMFL